MNFDRCLSSVIAYLLELFSITNELYRFFVISSDMRLKFLTLLVFFVLSISISVTFLRYGVGVLQDNFIAQLSTNYRNSSEFRKQLAFFQVGSKCSYFFIHCSCSVRITQLLHLHNGIRLFADKQCSFR